MIKEEHKNDSAGKMPDSVKLRNHAVITAICIFGVLLLAVAGFVITNMIIGDGVKYTWLSFIYAIPLAIIVWLVFNSVWFNKRRNYLIISLLVWSILTAIFTSFVMFGVDMAWKIFILGIPAQIIIFLCSRLKYKSAR